MFPMKFYNKLIFWFTIIAFVTSCGNNLKQNTTKIKYEETSNFGRFLSTKYSLKVGDNDIASKIISKSKNLQSDLTLAELNFNSFLIKGNFDKANEFKLVGDLIFKVVQGLSKNKENNSIIEKEVRKEIIDLCSSFPIYGK